MNAYTNSMANYSGGANAVVSGLQSMHQGHHADPNGLVGGMGMANQGGMGGVPVSLPTGGIRTAFHHAPGVGTLPQQQQQQQHHHHQHQVYAEAPAAKKPRQDSMMNAHQQHGLMAQQGGLQQVPQVSAAGGVSLPVGVGIRLGGPGGVAPSSAQGVARPPGAPAQFGWGPPGATGGAPDHAAAERRQRNREHAKRSRVRKKFMLESLQAEVLDLQKENQRLRMLVQEHIPNDAMKIISECCSDSPLFSDEELGIDGKARKAEVLTKSDFSLINSLTSGQQCFVLSDPKLPDNPIVFASPGFYQLTGYTPKEVLGRNCRFLQGPGTNPKAVDVIRKAVSAGSDATVCILNYKADGTPFWNQFFIAALRDSDNSIVNYVSVS